MAISVTDQTCLSQTLRTLNLTKINQDHETKPIIAFLYGVWMGSDLSHKALAALSLC